jgi:putative PIN family toxin of toxin-antitoxin system
VKAPKIVLDTNVLVSALRSRQGASYRLLTLVGTGRFELCLTVPLVLEYESVSKRGALRSPLSHADIDGMIDYLCRVGKAQSIFFLWRPCLRDPKDDMVLEAAVAGSCEVIVTFNKRDFAGAFQFGIKILTPKEFLGKIGGLS